jgi:hypothetical protein
VEEYSKRWEDIGHHPTHQDLRFSVNPCRGFGVLLASAMSLQDVQSLPPAVYWALKRAEMFCRDDPKAYSMEFMRLMKLKGWSIVFFEWFRVLMT